MTDPNQRLYPRAKYPCQLTIWFQNGDNETILAQTVNISQGGLCVRVNQGVMTGVKVDMQIVFSEPTFLLRCSGIVVRAAMKDQQTHDLGIRFEPLKEPDRVFLQKKVAELIGLEQQGNS